MGPGSSTTVAGTTMGRQPWSDKSIRQMTRFVREDFHRDPRIPFPGGRRRRPDSSTSGQAFSYSYTDVSNRPTQDTKRATGEPQGDSFRLRRGFGYASASIISPAVSIVSHSTVITYKPGHRTCWPFACLRQPARSSFVSVNCSQAECYLHILFSILTLLPILHGLAAGLSGERRRIRKGRLTQSNPAAGGFAPRGGTGRS